jgi:hypothetical protein
MKNMVSNFKMAKKNKALRLPIVTVQKEQSTIRANDAEIKIMGLVSQEISSNKNAIKLKPYVALKYFSPDWQCFSEWTVPELKSFSAFINTLKQHTWEQVYKTGGKGVNKTGLGYTKYDLTSVKNTNIQKKLEAVKKEISEDLNFFELRVDQKARVHGFQSQSTFFLIALDRNHEAF